MKHLFFWILVAMALAAACGGESSTTQALGEDPPGNSLDDESSDDDSNSNGCDKVELCHTPPGNEDNAHTIKVCENAAQAHLDHGDTLGECEDSSDDDSSSCDDEPLPE